MEDIKNLSFTVPPFLDDALEAESTRLGQTKSALVRMILTDWVEKRRSVTDGVRAES